MIGHHFSQLLLGTLCHSCACLWVLGDRPWSLLGTLCHSCAKRLELSMVVILGGRSWGLMSYIQPSHTEHTELFRVSPKAPPVRLPSPLSPLEQTRAAPSDPSVQKLEACCKAKEHAWLSPQDLDSVPGVALLLG